MNLCNLTIKDLENLVHQSASQIWVEGKWVCVQFASVRFKIPLAIHADKPWLDAETKTLISQTTSS